MMKARTLLNTVLEVFCILGAIMIIGGLISAVIYFGEYIWK